MAKNVIIMIGDGMGWEMARAAATANGADFYTEGKGNGLSFQNLSNYALATTYGTTIAPGNGKFSTGNSALDNSISQTGDSALLPGFTFDPTFNSGTTASGGANNQISRGSTLLATDLLDVKISGNNTLISKGSDLLATLRDVQLNSVSIV